MNNSQKIRKNAAKYKLSEVDHRLVTVERLGDAYFVWSVEDIRYLRRTQNICGSLVGSVASLNGCARQSTVPLTLGEEEVCTLVKHGIATCAHQSPSSSAVPTVDAHDEREAQSIVHHRNVTTDIRGIARRAALGRVAKARKVAANSELRGKQRKVRPVDLLDVTVTEEEVDRVVEELAAKTFHLIHDADIIVETCVASPFTRTDTTLPSSSPSLRQMAYEHFWLNGYMITSGLKFGCDFLLYPGDISHFHSSHMVICSEGAKEVSATALASYARVATNVHKTVVIAYLDGGHELQLTHVRWQRLEQSCDKHYGLPFVNALLHAKNDTQTRLVDRLAGEGEGETTS